MWLNEFHSQGELLTEEASTAFFCLLAPLCVNGLSHWSKLQYFH